MPPASPEIRELTCDLLSAPQTAEQCQRVKQKMGEIDVARAMPGAAPQSCLSLLDQNPSIHPCTHQSGNKHESFGCGNKTETLISEAKQRMCGQMVDHHHYQ